MNVRDAFTSRTLSLLSRAAFSTAAYHFERFEAPDWASSGNNWNSSLCTQSCSVPQTMREGFATTAVGNRNNWVGNNSTDGLPITVSTSIRLG